MSFIVIRRQYDQLIKNVTAPQLGTAETKIAVTGW